MEKLMSRLMKFSSARRYARPMDDDGEPAKENGSADGKESP